LFSVDTLPVFENIRRQCCPTGWAKKNSKLSFTSSSNIDEFYRFFHC